MYCSIAPLSWVQIRTLEKYKFMWNMRIGLPLNMLYKLLKYVLCYKTVVKLMLGSLL